jgi:hypothetical protein
MSHALNNPKLYSKRVGGPPGRVAGVICTSFPQRCQKRCGLGLGICSLRFKVSGIRVWGVELRMKDLVLIV